jgi:hypothetical protein
MSTASPVSYSDSMRCPLCEQDNQCAVAAGREASSCWCMSTTINEEAKQRAANIGADKRCLCRQCGHPIDN